MFLDKIHKNKSCRYSKVTQFLLMRVFSKINPLITTYQNRCKNWVFLNFLETGLSQRNDTGEQSYRQ